VAKERAVISARLRKPKAATHRSARGGAAAEVALSATTVHRIWQKYGLQLHRVETFKFNRDPEPDFKRADIRALSRSARAPAGAVRGRKTRRFRRLTAVSRCCRCGPGCPPA
jgi:hypothetical protein